MLANTRDAFGGQSVKVTKHITIRCVSYGLLVCYSNFVHKIFDFKNAVTLKTGLRVRQGHWKCHHAIERIRLPIDVHTLAQ